MILSSVREVLWKRSVGVLKINKRTPPPEFVGAAVRAKYTYYRALPGKKTPYDLLESKAKEALGKALATEQGHLCVEYTNLFASCRGGEGEPKRLQTCDTHKGNAIISVNPLNSDSIAKISYGYDGKVKSDDSDIEQDLNDTLNLNVEKLKRNRLEAWNHMRARIARKNLNEQIKMYTAFIEGEGQVNSDMKMEYAGFLLFMAGRELRKLKGKQKGLRR